MRPRASRHRPTEPERRQAAAREEQHDRTAGEEVGDLAALGLVTDARGEILVDLGERGARAGAEEPAAAQPRDLLQGSWARWNADLLFEAADELLRDDAARRPDEHGGHGNVRGPRRACRDERCGLPAVASAVGDDQ